MSDFLNFPCLNPLLEKITISLKQIKHIYMQYHWSTRYSLNLERGNTLIRLRTGADMDKISPFF